MVIKHINEIKLEGETPWIKAFNEASDYWKKYCKATTEKEKDDAFEQWSQIRYEIETGRYGN